VIPYLGITILARVSFWTVRRYAFKSLLAVEMADRQDSFGILDLWILLVSSLKISLSLTQIDTSSLEQWMASHWLPTTLLAPALTRFADFVRRS